MFPLGSSVPKDRVQHSGGLPRLTGVGEGSVHKPPEKPCSFLSQGTPNTVTQPQGLLRPLGGIGGLKPA